MDLLINNSNRFRLCDHVSEACVWIYCITYGSSDVRHAQILIRYIHIAQYTVTHTHKHTQYIRTRTHNTYEHAQTRNTYEHAYTNTLNTYEHAYTHTHVQGNDLEASVLTIQLHFYMCNYLQWVIHISFGFISQYSIQWMVCNIFFSLIMFRIV